MLLKSWSIPVVVSLGLFLVLRPVFAQFVDTQSVGIGDYLKNNNVKVGEDVVDGFSVVYYAFEEVKTYVSPKGVNSKQASTSGQFIVWVSEAGDLPGQINLYNILTGSTAQLTFSGTNGNPKVSKDGYVVWEGWVPSASSGQVEGWQIFFFDGVKTVQLTFGDASFNPEIDGDNITYARRDITGTYRGVLYSIKRGKEKDITTGIDAKYPRVMEGKIYLGGTGDEREFELTAEDLFTLDLIPLASTESGSTEVADSESVEGNASPETVTVDDIFQELQ